MHKEFDIIPAPEQRLKRRPLFARVQGKLSRMVFGFPPQPTATGWPSMPYATNELVYWRPATGVNFGDELARTVVDLMLAKNGCTVFDEVRHARKVLSIGSVLHVANDNSVVWGAGVNGSVSETEHRYKSLDIRAVRGPLTRQFLTKRGISVPEVYGDPALLIKQLAGSRFSSEKEYTICLVPNMFDMKVAMEQSALSSVSNVTIIDPRRSWNCVVQDILKCELVLASSLHGLVVADAFDIPSRFVRFSEHEGLLKYEDYYESTGRRLSYAKSIDQALDMGPVAAPVIDLSKLHDAFPWDAWA